MRKTNLRIASLLIASSLVLATGCGASETPASTDEVQSTLEEIVTVANVSKTTESSPNQTIYVITGADGQVEKVFDDEVEDASIPVDITISYYLDGSAITPEELAGKSGHVTVRFDYVNNQYEYAEINGENVKMYVPFTMVSGLLLDDSKFSNIEITNGKLVDDGNRTIALGVAFPGLSENLDLDSYDIDTEIPSYVEISADVTDFSLDMTLSIATNEVFSEFDTDNITTLDDLNDSLDELNDAMDQILDGSAALYAGLDTLYSKIGELSDGTQSLKDGSEKLMNGASELNSGAAKLASGTSELSNGLSTLASNNDTLNGAAATVFNTLLASASSQLQAAGFDVTLTIDNYSQTLDALIANAGGYVTSQVNANDAQITAAVTSAVKSQVTTQVTAAVKAQVTSQVTEAVKSQVTSQVQANEAAIRAGVLSSAGYTEEQYNASEEVKAAVDSEVTRQMNAMIDEKMASDDVQATIDSTVESKMASDEVKNTITSTVDSKMASDEVQATIASNVASQKAGLIESNTSSAVASLTSAKTQLDSYNQFYTGLKTYTAGVSSAASGASKLNAGANELKSGAQSLYDGTVELYNGASTLNDAMPALSDGVEQLRDGAGELDDGLNQFNEEGIQKINDVLADDIEVLVDRFEATVNASKNYKAASSDDENSSIKFIFRSESIE